MPERQRGGNPNKQPRKERETAPYHRAVQYPDEQSSEAPYDQAQQAIYETPCDLSAYRLLLGSELRWHVVVLGTTPPPELTRRINDILSGGKPITLPDEMLRALTERRKQQIIPGGFVEKHHLPRRRRLR